METLRARAALLAAIRRFFAGRGIWEVETPVLSRAATTEPHLSSFQVGGTAPSHFLHTSPELPMKRLLAAGSGSIYQLCKVFRRDESGPGHNPEFTLLEWYEIGVDYHGVMTTTAALVHECLLPYRHLAAPRYLTYRAAFEAAVGLDPHEAGPAALRQRAIRLGLDVPALGDDGNAWRDLLMSHVVAPGFAADRLTFVHDYPAPQASLARVRPGPPAVAERFEAYLGPVELANGFTELADAAEQARRIAAEQVRRVAAGAGTVPVDGRFLDALAAGLPACAGVALGVDRLLMVALGAGVVQEVMAFPEDRA